MPHDRLQVQEWLDAETSRLLSSVQTFRQRDMREPSTLLDWSLGQLLTHLARNADALRNLLVWAQTRIETPMYESPKARNDDIYRGALRATDDIIDDVVATACALSENIGRLADADWQTSVRTAHGRTLPAAEVPWLRLREVALHHVDLGARVEDIPLSLTTELLADVAKTVGPKSGWPRLEIKASDSNFHHVGPADSVVFVSGTSAQLLGWLTGRAAGEGLVVSGGVIPQLPNWL
jgi:maleylpyruvate isomerase